MLKHFRDTEGGRPVNEHARNAGAEQLPAEGGAPAVILRYASLSCMRSRVLAAGSLFFRNLAEA